MEESKNFKIKSVGAELKLYINIFGHLLLKVEDWSSMTTDRGNGDEEDYEYGSAGISLDKDRVIQLRDKLNEFIETMTDKSGWEYTKDLIKNQNK